ncbi:MAG: NAD(P)H-dependent oxidoreductase [Deltaproteobacteria bacterium]|nr:NAD(P)H-dependent oxidoreductase [Deltaproteobacteria bacterium]
MPRTIALVVGSLRKDSTTRKVANAIVELASPELTFVPIPIGQLPLFNQDLEATPPKEWLALRSAVKAVDGVLFATPEYNRSVPGVLKNALDVGSRPYGKSVWAGKPGAVISQAGGSIGGFGANHHLRQSLAYLDVPCLTQPEMYIGNSAKLWDDKGELVASTRELFQKFVTAFVSWVERFANSTEQRKSA